jgi:stage III sporulation protein AB
MLDEGTSNSVYESFEKAYLENKEKLSLNSDDYKILEDFFKTLGSSGISGQEKIFSLALENIDINYKEAKKKEKENIKLYRTLGISIGAMLAIFFI